MYTLPTDKYIKYIYRLKQFLCIFIDRITQVYYPIPQRTQKIQQRDLRLKRPSTIVVAYNNAVLKLAEGSNNIF